MITVRIECTVVMNGRHITSCPKVYVFDTMHTAEKFVEYVNELPQPENSDNWIRAILVEETAYVTQDAEPLFLHTIYLTKPEEGKAREVDYHGIDLYTVAEIEDFRNIGKHPAIVYAYDNRGCLEPAVLTEDEFSEGANGGNYHFGAEDEEFFLSFNPDIEELVKAKYCN